MFYKTQNGLFRVVSGGQLVTMRQMGMIVRLLNTPAGVILCRFLVVFGRLLVVVCRFFVMLCRLLMMLRGLSTMVFAFCHMGDAGLVFCL